MVNFSNAFSASMKMQQNKIKMNEVVNAPSEACLQFIHSFNTYFWTHSVCQTLLSTRIDKAGPKARWFPAFMKLIARKIQIQLTTRSLFLSCQQTQRRGITSHSRPKSQTNSVILSSIHSCDTSLNLGHVWRAWGIYIYNFSHQRAVIF